MKYLINTPELKNKRFLLRKNQTDAEKILWSRLRNRQLNGVKFFRQYSIGRFIVDFYSPKHRLAIEIDGGQHNETINQQKDMERTSNLRKYGVKVVRFWNNDVLTDTVSALNVISNNVTPPNLPLI